VAGRGFPGIFRKYVLYVDERAKKKREREREREEHSWTYAIKKARFPAAGLCRRLITALEERTYNMRRSERMGEISYKGPLT